jgi:hypothetical protein
MLKDGRKELSVEFCSSVKARVSPRKSGSIGRFLTTALNLVTRWAPSSGYRSGPTLRELSSVRWLGVFQAEDTKELRPLLVVVTSGYLEKQRPVVAVGLQGKCSSMALCTRSPGPMHNIICHPQPGPHKLVAGGRDVAVLFSLLFVHVKPAVFNINISKEKQRLCAGHSHTGTVRTVSYQYESERRESIIVAVVARQRN